MPVLNADQAAAIRVITSSGRGIDLVEALAGTGKTTMVGGLAASYQLAGWRVIGTAPTGRAARQLRELAGIPAGTMHSLVAELDRGGGFGPRTVMVLDEAGMAPTRLAARLFASAERAGVKVIAIGDPGQLGSIEAGGWLAALARQQPAPQLREVMRQRDPEERAALEALRDGEPADYLACKQDALAVHPTEHEALARLLEQWHAAQRQHGLCDAVMIARDNHSRGVLNQAARECLKRDGTLTGHGIVIGLREFVEGDRVIARRNDRHLDVDNGTLGSVVSIGWRTRTMQIRIDTGEIRCLDRDYVGEHLEHAYALTGHSAQSGTVAWAGVIGRPEGFTRDWAYTALSRAREQTVIHVIAERSEREHERDDFGPVVADRDRAETLRVLHRAMKRSQTERLAVEEAPPGRGLHRRAAEGTEATQLELEQVAQLDLRNIPRLSPPPFRGPSRWPLAHDHGHSRVLEL